MKKINLKLATIKIIELIIVVFVVLICYNQGKIDTTKKYQCEYNKLLVKYNELKEEYKDYKEHSYVLNGYDYYKNLGIIEIK